MFDGMNNEGLHPVDAAMQERSRSNRIGEWVRLKVQELRAKSALEALESGMHADELLDAGLHFHGLDVGTLVPGRRRKKKT